MNLVVTNHAVERYVERYKPQLGLAQARIELEALTGLVTEPLPDKPEWLGNGRAADAWLELTNDVVAVVKDRSVITIFHRTGSSRKVREIKKARKKERRAEKHKVRVHSRRSRSELRDRKEATWD